jgi:predicted ATPase/transcriptional regulator with XRE-family HTH domain
VLRAHRRAAGLTQQELAGRAGVGVRTVRELERGRATRPQRGTVELLADALGLTGTGRTRFVEAARGRLLDAAEPRAASRVPPTIALPPPLPLVGRDDDLREVAGLVAACDVVLLVGLAGVGKTCLAIAVAHHVADRFPGGVAGIFVSDVSGPDDILASAASVFGVARAAHLTERCAGRPTLLLVDGVERAPEAAATALAWLRANAPGLRLVATSRHPVDLPGIVAWPVTPLDVPPRAGTSVPAPDLAMLSAYPAISLFLERLRQVRRHPVEPAELPVLGELVRRLGGLPLAIELAAARGRVLELHEILDRYGHRMLDLGEPRPDGQTLRGAVAASYRLLDSTEQSALERLAAFAGRWSVGLAEELLGGLVGDVEAVLDRLVGLGLVSVRAAGPLRFRLLDVVRDFAIERCAEAGHLASVRTRHARVFADLAVRTAPDLAGPTMSTAVSLLDHLQSDLGGALQHAADAEPATALRLAGALTRWWRFRGRDREGRVWLRGLLADPRNAEADERARAWAELGAATLAIEHGEGVAELAAARLALGTFARLGDVSGELAAHSCLSMLWQAVGGIDDARRHGEALLALATRSGRAREIVVAHNNLTWHEIRVGELGAAARRLEAVVGLAAEVDDTRLTALALANLAEVARLDRRYAVAVGTARRAVALLADVGDPGHRVRVLGTVGLALAEAGELAEAEAIRAALAEAGQAADGYLALIGGYLARARGERAQAAKLFEAAAASLLGHHDSRDVLEALVGVAASTDDPAARGSVLAQVEELCRRGGLTLLPRDLAMLDG